MKIGYFGIIIRHGKILLVQPSDDGGYWALPGGGKNKKETPRAATIREITEETSLNASLGPQLGTFKRTDMQAKLVIYWVTKTRGKVKPDGKEIRRCRWFSLEEMWERRENIKPYHFSSIFRALDERRNGNKSPIEVKLNGLPTRKQWKRIIKALDQR
jgi:ADP-ribose pyrophosphatase YjhB (NUDIX family)